jgi:hypothetical protein
MNRAQGAYFLDDNNFNDSISELHDLIKSESSVEGETESYSYSIRVTEKRHSLWSIPTTEKKLLAKNRCGERY